MKLNRKKFDLARARACKGTKELEASGISREVQDLKQSDALRKP